MGQVYKQFTPMKDHKPISRSEKYSVSTGRDSMKNILVRSVRNHILPLFNEVDPSNNSLLAIIQGQGQKI